MMGLYLRVTITVSPVSSWLCVGFAAEVIFVLLVILTQDLIKINMFRNAIIGQLATLIEALEAQKKDKIPHTFNLLTKQDCRYSLKLE